MGRPRDVVKVYVKVPIDGYLTLGTGTLGMDLWESIGASAEWVDVTDGLLGMNISRGIRDYQGRWSAVEAGQLNITSRNHLLDPYATEILRYNRTIQVRVNEYVLFTGSVAGVNVEYRPKGEPPVVNITAFDLVWALQKFVLPDLVTKEGNTTTLAGLAQDIDWISYYLGNSYDFTVSARYGNTGMAAIKTGTTAWEALVQRGISENGIVYVSKDNALWCYSSPLTPTRTTKAMFDASGSGLSYKAINVTDGFERMANQVVISNNGSYNTFTGTPAVWQSYVEVRNEYGPYKDDASIAKWGVKQLTIDTCFSGSASIATYANSILANAKEPEREIKSITWDGMDDPMKATDIDILDRIEIRHITDYVTIFKQYAVMGITHEITEGTWRVTYQVWNLQGS